MRQTKERESSCRLAVDIEGLAAMLSCGQMTARKIAEDAGARITIGRRVLYSVQKVVLCQEKVQIKYAFLVLSYPAKASALFSNAA